MNSAISILIMLGLAVTNMFFGIYLFSIHDPYVNHRVVCNYQGGQQEGDLCVKNGRAYKIDLSYLEK